MLNYEFPPLGGGSSPVTLHLGRELVRLGHEVDLVTMGGRGLAPRETVAGIRVRRVPALRLRRERCSTPEMLTYCLSAVPRLPGMVKRGRHAVNHTHFIFPTGLAARLLKLRTGLPYLITSHGSDVPGYNPDRFRLSHRILAPLWRWIVRGAALITAPSEHHAALVRSHAPWARVLAVPNGIDPAEFSPDKPRERIVLGAGRLFRRKDFHTLVEAMAGLDPSWRLVLLGEGPERTALETLARARGVPLEITGWLGREDGALQAWFERAGIFALTSESESFGMVVAEAMAAGAPVVVSDQGGPAEVAGEAGLLVPPGDAGALRRALETLMASEERRLELGRLGRGRACREYAWERVATRFVELYASLAQDRPGFS